MAPVVTFTDAVALLGAFPALAGCTITVDPGEVVLVRGPNGAGKTTLLRACAGLVPIVDGTAEVAGVDLRRDRRTVRRRVALLGHHAGLYDDLTVADNVRFWARAHRTEIDLDATLGRVGLGGRLADVTVAQLSAGQRRRCALAVLVATDARLWLLDEPHAGLDAEGRDLLDALVADAAARATAVMLASHEADRASGVADRIVTVAGGRVVADTGAGSPVAETAGVA